MIKLEKVKNKKSPGPNLLKPELYKELGNSDFCTKTMARVYENQMHSDKIPKSWKGTRTKVIKKIKKPMVKDFRPIALANISYKLLMSIVKDQIEEHIEQNNLIKHNQTGFTKGGRKEDNLFVLQYLVEKTYKQDKPLIVISIDYSKAYDSIDRKRMIETMIKYKIHPNIIDIVSKVYQDDFTNLVFGEHEEKINITSGIKQGCTGSTTLFKLITYEIIKEMEKHGECLEIDGTTLNSLFFADDSLTMADTKENAEKNLKILKRVSESFGLKINKEKSKILVYNSKEDIEEIEGIQVTDKIKYLGIIIDNKKELFQSHKEAVIEKAKFYANMMYHVTGKCVNRMLIGKTYWKNMIIPKLLHGTGVMTFSAKEIGELQREENAAYRRILDVRRNTPTSALRGEIGSSLMVTRIMETKILFTRSILKGSNKLTKQVLKVSRKEKNNIFNTTLKGYLKKWNIKFEEISTLSFGKIKTIARKWDTRKWIEDMKEKSSLKIYREFKKEIKEEKYYDNRESSKYLFLARSNTLPLNIKRKYTGGDTKCELCNTENEDLVHFLINCKKLEHKRNKEIMLKNRNENKETMVGNILFKEDKEKTKEMITQMWNYRAGMNIEKEKKIRKESRQEKLANKQKRI